MAGTNFLAVAVAAAFAVTLVVNYTVTSGIGVKFTNSDIADSHPTYLLPIGWAFSIWGLIYLLFACFAVYQALPHTWEDAEVESVRRHALAAFALNVCWLYLFSFEVYWIAFLFIAAYAGTLLHAVNTLGMDFTSANSSWKSKLLVAAPFSANASWVVVATCLQTGVNFIEEGWVASPDFCCGLLFLAASLAVVQCAKRADVFYGFVAFWALFGIINNQAEGSTFGCASRICKQSCLDDMQLCSSEGRFGPTCAAYAASGEDICVIPKSGKVRDVAWLLIASVLASVVVGVARGCFARGRANSESKEEQLIMQAGELPAGRNL